MDRLTSWWVRAFFRWFSESAYHSTHDITPSSHQLFLSIWPLEALGRSLVPPKTGSTFLPCTSAQMIPIISQEVLGESMWNHVKLKTKGLWLRISLWRKGKRAEQWSMQVVVTVLSLEQHVQCDHSNYDVKPWGTGQLKENVSITYASNTTTRWQSQTSDK